MQHCAWPLFLEALGPLTSLLGPATTQGTTSDTRAQDSRKVGVSGLMLTVARSLGMSRLCISPGPQTSLGEHCPRPSLIHLRLSRGGGGGRHSAGLLEN